jgi:arylsulfatase A-like enzyme
VRAWDYEEGIEVSRDAPNILILLCDQLRRDGLRIYGDRNVATGDHYILAPAFGCGGLPETERGNT